MSSNVDDNKSLFNTLTTQSECFSLSVFVKQTNSPPNSACQWSGGQRFQAVYNTYSSPEGSGRYVVDGLDDTEQGRVGADRHVGSAEVVVDRADNTDDVEEGALFAVLRRNCPCQRDATPQNATE